MSTTPIRTLPGSKQRTDDLIENLRRGLRDNTIKAIRINGEYNLDDGHAQTLAEALLYFNNNNNNNNNSDVSSSVLETVDIRGPCPKLTPVGVRILVDALAHLNHIARVDLENIHVGDEGAMAVARLLQQTKSLKTLGLDARSTIGIRGWEVLVQQGLLHNNNDDDSSSLEVLDLRRNELTDRHMTMLALALRHTKLQGLILSMNQIGDDGIETLAQELLMLPPSRVSNNNNNNTSSSSSLVMLALSDNQFTIRGLQALHKMLKVNCSLKRMYLHGNKFPYTSPEKRSITYLLELNAAGRAIMRNDDNDSTNLAMMPYILARVCHQPHVLYGLLSELPHVWASSVGEEHNNNNNNNV